MLPISGYKFLSRRLLAQDGLSPAASPRSGLRHWRLEPLAQQDGSSTHSGGSRGRYTIPGAAAAAVPGSPGRAGAAGGSGAAGSPMADARAAGFLPLADINMLPAATLETIPATDAASGTTGSVVGSIEVASMQSAGMDSPGAGAGPSQSQLSQQFVAALDSSVADAVPVRLEDGINGSGSGKRKEGAGAAGSPLSLVPDTASAEQPALHATAAVPAGDAAAGAAAPAGVPKAAGYAAKLTGVGSRMQVLGRLLHVAVVLLLGIWEVCKHWSCVAP